MGASRPKTMNGDKETSKESEERGEEERGGRKEDREDMRGDERRGYKKKERKEPRWEKRRKQMREEGR